MFDLSGKTALVTGASGAIGAAIASALHLQGASVVLHGTRAERLAALQAELVSAPIPSPPILATVRRLPKSLVRPSRRRGQSPFW